VNLLILKKYFENKCTPEEVKDILHWLEHSDEATILDEEFRLVWDKLKVKPADPQKWHGKLDKIHEKIEMEELYSSLDIKEADNGKPVNRLEKTAVLNSSQNTSTSLVGWKYALPVAASLIVLFVWFFTLQQNPSPEPVQEERVVTKGTEPGQKLSIQLSDGSRVILNSSSKLTYNDFFGHDERVVYLEGEAFFEVNRDTLRPFKVIAGEISTTALGTSFNINAFNPGKTIDIALVSGKVLIEDKRIEKGAASLVLLPGEMATFNKQAGDLSKRKFNTRDLTGWKDGIITFRNARYGQIIEKLERWYGVEISEDRIPVKDWNFTGTFENENLENLLNTLQFEYEFSYQIDKKKVNINFN
jgi:transmembrane sensor